MGKRFVLVMLAITLVIGSCSKDSVSTNNKLSAKIDGKSWNASFRVTNLTGNVFVITGTSITGEILAITINGDSPDLYQLGLGNLECAATYKGSALASTDDIYQSVSGKVNLTKVDKTNKKISGTFDFSLAKLSLTSISVSNGTFNDLEYTETGI